MKKNEVINVAEAYFYPYDFGDKFVQVPVKIGGWVYSRKQQSMVGTINHIYDTGSGFKINGNYIVKNSTFSVIKKDGVLYTLSALS